MGVVLFDSFGESVKVGLFGARADSRGLAHQTAAFANHLHPDRVFGIDMTADNLSPYPTDWSPYTDFAREGDFTWAPLSNIDEDVARKWLRGLDVVFGAETFYRPEFVDWARAEGVRTILQVNPEFAPWWNTALRHPPPTKPDVLIAPTTWLLSKMPGVIHLPCPVDRQRFPFRLRTEANHFVHTAGHPAMGDRAGTRTVLATLARMPQTRLTIRAQQPLGLTTPHMKRSNVTIQETSFPDSRDLYADADVIILPRRYGGQHLGVNEALSSGCPVVMLHREPERHWGGVLTIQARARAKMRTQFGMIERYDTSAILVAETMKKLIAAPKLVEELSRRADEYAESISWDTLLPRYRVLFDEVAAGVLT